MKKICLFIAVALIFMSCSACGNDTGSKRDNKKEIESVKIETRGELVEIMGGVLEVDFDTLWNYHYMLNDPYYICGYVVPNSFYASGFVFGDDDYSFTTPTIDVMDYHYSESDYKENTFLYIKALPNGESSVFLQELSKTKIEDEYLSVEEYCTMSKKVFNSFFEITGFIGSVEEEDGYWLCKMYESKNAYKNDDIDWSITLLFDEYPNNINGTEICVVGKYSYTMGPMQDEPLLRDCSVVSK